MKTDIEIYKPNELELFRKQNGLSVLDSEGNERIKAQTITSLTTLSRLAVAKAEGREDIESALSLAKQESKLTISKAIYEGTSISLLRKENEMILEASVTQLLYCFNNSFNRKQKLSDVQIIELMIGLIDTYYFYKLEEFQLVLKNLKKQEIYNLEPALIEQAFFKHNEKRTQHAENQSMRDNQHSKNAKFNPLTDEQVDRLYSGKDTESHREAVRRSEGRKGKTDQERQSNINNAIKKGSSVNVAKWEWIYNDYSIEELRVAYRIAASSRDVKLMNWLIKRVEQLKDK